MNNLNLEIEEMLFEAANYADAIVAIAKEHEDDPSFVLLADKCSSVICEAIEKERRKQSEVYSESCPCKEGNAK